MTVVAYKSNLSESSLSVKIHIVKFMFSVLWPNERVERLLSAAGQHNPVQCWITITFQTEKKNVQTYCLAGSGTSQVKTGTYSKFWGGFSCRIATLCVTIKTKTIKTGYKANIKQLSIGAVD